MAHNLQLGKCLVFCLLMFSMVNAQTIPAASTTTSTTEKTQEKFHLRNAYEVARWMYRSGLQNSKVTESQYKELLGSLIWYSNSQDDTGDKYTMLTEKIECYEKINSFAGKLLQRLEKLKNFFAFTSDQVEPYLTSVPPAFREIVRKKKKDYETKKNALTLVKLNKVEQEARYTRDIANFEQERVRSAELYNTQINAKLKLRDPIDSIESKKAEVEKLSREIDSLTNLKKLADEAKIDEIRIKNQQLQNLARRVTEKELELETEEISIKNYLLDNKALNSFVLNISGVSSDDTYQNINLVDAYSAFTANSLPEMQQVMAEAGAAASRLMIRLPSEAEMINALAIYLANRIKQESVMWFFEKITQNANRYKLLNLFFPTTMKLLQGNEVYEIPNLGAQWQYALSKDFMQMPKNVLTSEWLQQRWPAYTTYGSYIVGVCDFAELITKRYSYADAIKTLYLSRLQTPAANNPTDGLAFNDYITLFYAINSELFAVGDSNKMRMLTYEDFRGMNRQEIEMMLELLDLKYNGVFSKFLKGIRWQKDKPVEVLDIEKIRRLFGNIQSAISQVEKIGTEYLEEQKKLQQNGQKDWFYNTYNIWGAINQVFEVMSTLDKSIVQENNIAAAKKVFDYGGQVFEIYNLVTKKNFAGAVINTINLVDHLFYGENIQQHFSVPLSNLKNDDLFSGTELKYAIINELEKEKNKFIFSTDNPTVISFKKNSPMAAVVFENERHSLQLIRKLSGFLNDAALAQNDKQLAKVVESYAMPVGSYKRKRNNWWSLDLNAFAGPYIGYEWTRRQKRDYTAFLPERSGGVWGISVPIGLSLSKTIGKKWSKRKTTTHELPDDYVRNPDKLKLKSNDLYYRSNSTITLTASIVDLGAIVSYRLGNTNDTTINQSLKWSQFISPGLHLAYALKGSPFVISAGIQYTPQLRKYEEAGKVNEKQFNATRVYLGIMFDLPLFNFWERKHIVYIKKK